MKRPLGQIEQIDIPAVPVTWVVPTKLVQRYGEANIQQLHRWWTEVGLRMLQGTQPLIYLAGIQLFFLFNMHTAHQGPWCLKKRWYSFESDAPVVARTTWGARTGLFMRMLRCYQKANNLVIPSKMARPHSTAIGRWMMCFKVRWCQSQLDRVDQLILDQLGRQVNTPADLASLVAAKIG